MEDSETSSQVHANEDLESLNKAVRANEDEKVINNSSNSSQSGAAGDSKDVNVNNSTCSSNNEEEDSGLLDEAAGLSNVENVNNTSCLSNNEEEDSGLLDDVADSSNDVNVNNSTCSSNHEEEDSGLLDEVAGFSNDNGENNFNLSKDNEDLPTDARNNRYPVQENGHDLYKKLDRLYSDGVVYYPEKFKCQLCLKKYDEFKGIILKECLHIFCRACLLNTIKMCEPIAVKCPFRDDSYSCPSVLLESEIKSLLSPDDYENRLSVSLAYAGACMDNTFHCLLPDCNGWCIMEDEMTVFVCPVCSIISCIVCRAIHEGVTCAEFQDIQESGEPSDKATNQDKGNNFFRELENLYLDALVYYPDKFECPICLENYDELNGIILKECLHVFCRDCLLNTIELCEGVDVGCPFRNDSYSCSSFLLEEEIKSLLSPEAYEKRLSKTLAFAEATMKNTFHCKTPDCKGWCIIDDSTSVFLCPVCSITNCIQCKVIHEGITCAEYQDILMNKSEVNLSSKLSEAAVRDMVQCGVAMKCPNCQAVITKQGGCDGIICSFCHIMICWATKGPRWGPRGTGDDSGGCRCNVNGIKCHPKCQNCH